MLPSFPSHMDIVKRLLQGDKITLARAISKVENGDTSILRDIYKHTGNAYYVGITGPPGAGKSTIVDRLTSKLLVESNLSRREMSREPKSRLSQFNRGLGEKHNKKIGIIAVDPTSPFSGGALLGDRIRMPDIATRDGVFIRSMASRGSLGGLAWTTKNVALLFDAAGMDYIFIETVGVGQVELDIAGVCDTTIIVLVPESGDSIQTMKAGLLEIADIIVVNKADRDGADRIVAELRFISELRVGTSRRLAPTNWEYPVMKTIAIEEKGIDELISLIESHREYLERTDNFEQARKQRIKLRVQELIEERIKSHIEKNVIKPGVIDEIVEKIYTRKKDPFQSAEEITSSLF